MSAAEWLWRGQVVRVGEATLIGHAWFTPDPRQLDLVWVRDDAPFGPFHLLTAHYPGEVDVARLREAVGALLPELTVTGPCSSLSPSMASIGPMAEGWCLDCRLDAAEERLDLAVRLVVAVEEGLAVQGLRPRRIDRVARGEAGEGANPERRPSFAERLLRWRLPFGSLLRAKGAGSRVAGAGEAPAVQSRRGKVPHDPSWRLLLRPLNPGGRENGGPPGARGAAMTFGSGARGSPRRRTGASEGLLELPATAGRAALKAAYGEPPGRTPGPGLVFAPEDLVWRELSRRVPSDCCLLLDASASMAGRRGQAVSAMVDYLLRNSRGRLALVAFRGEEGRVLTGFTRSRRTLQAALGGLTCGGLTPLAAGLYAGYRLVRAFRPRRIQVILVTDGEPTKGLWSCDSIGDAVQAAALYRENRIPLACCGIAANEPLLGRIAEAGAGRFHLIRDFSAPTLLTVSRRLLGRIPGGTRGS